MIDLKWLKSTQNLTGSPLCGEKLPVVTNIGKGECPLNYFIVNHSKWQSFSEVILVIMAYHCSLWWHMTTIHEVMFLNHDNGHCKYMYVFDSPCSTCLTSVPKTWRYNNSTLFIFLHNDVFHSKIKIRLQCNLIKILILFK